MTKEMYEKCLNKDMVIFGKLPKDVQDAMKECGLAQFLNSDAKWERTCCTPSWAFNVVYRIDPSTPYDPEFEEKAVYPIFTGNFLGVNLGRAGEYAISRVLCHPNCLGIVYEKDGVETLRTSVDLAFGTPKRVRFAK